MFEAIEGGSTAGGAVGIRRAFGVFLVLKVIIPKVLIGGVYTDHFRDDRGKLHRRPVAHSVGQGPQRRGANSRGLEHIRFRGVNEGFVKIDAITGRELMIELEVELMILVCWV